MRGCPRFACPACNEEAIHRDHRHMNESSSTIGQIISREGPRTFTFADLDGAIRLWLGQADGRTLLRLLEHKQPDAKFKDPQKMLLRDLAELINHAITCPHSTLKLHPESGLFVIYGAVGADDRGRRATRLEGPQRIYRIERRDGRVVQHRVAITHTHAELFRWLSAGLDAPRAPTFFPIRNLPIGPGE